MGDSTKKLGLLGLTAIVFSSIIGGGIYNIAQNMAAHAGLGAIIIAWLITAAGMIFLVYTFKILADKRPDLNAGIYQYAQVGFGNYVGFNMAWGYWLCTATGNVAYAVMLNDSAGAFFPVFLNHGWPTVLFGSALIWLMYFLVIRGVKTASFINVLMTAIQIVSLILIVGILLIYSKLGMFEYDFWGNLTDLGSLGTQIKSTMLVTLWCFTGIEGAVMMSSRAKKATDVGKAGIIGFLAAWFLYALVSVLAFGIMHQPQLANLPDPSIAYVLKAACGSWAYYFVIIAVILSLMGGWIAWTLVCAQVPYTAAQVKIFPKSFLKTNRHDMPAFGLLVSSIIMQVFMCLVVTSDAVYLAALDLTSMMVLPAYLFCGLFLWKAMVAKKNYVMVDNPKQRVRFTIVAVIATLFCAYTLYAGSLKLLLVTTIFYLPGTFFYIKARRQYAPEEAVFTTAEKWICAGLTLCVVAAVILLTTGNASI